LSVILSIVIPVYRSQEILVELHRRIVTVQEFVEPAFEIRLTEGYDIVYGSPKSEIRGFSGNIVSLPLRIASILRLFLGGMGFFNSLGCVRKLSPPRQQYSQLSLLSTCHRYFLGAQLVQLFAPGN
jgi:hypothetical protein